VDKREELFNKFKELEYGLRSLSSIVQNETPNLPIAELINWSGDVDDFITELDDLRENIIEYYRTVKEMKEFGEKFAKYYEKKEME